MPRPAPRLAQRLVVAKVRAALGVKKCVVSGGGSLAPHLDDFFESIGLPVINGWGLTETSPVLACRRNFPGQNVRGSVGEGWAAGLTWAAVACSSSPTCSSWSLK